MKKIIIVLSLFSVLFPLASEPVTEFAGDEMRIVSLAPNITEILCALDCEQNIVGRTDYCNYPLSITDKPSVGTLYEPDLETIVFLSPTLVIAFSITDPQFIDSMSKTGIEVHQILNEETLEGTFDIISEIGYITGKSDKAETVIDDMKARISAVAEKIESIPSDERKSVIYMISFGDWGDYAATGDTYLDGVIEAAGGINAAEEGVYWSISREMLIKEDPSVILLSGYTGSDNDTLINSFINTEPYSQLTASKTGNVFVIDADAAERQGVRTADTIEAIAKLLYPTYF